MEESMSMSGGDPEIFLPPGFRFHPRDEEIITHYLTEKVMNSGFSASAIGEVNLNKVEPWDLHKKAKMGEKEWYFFCQNDRKYPTGLRTNRATESGYWKATGKDREIYRGKNCLVGMKKTLVFYLGRAPKGEKSNWVMHEYRLEGKFSYRNLPKFSKDEWVVCRIFHKSTGIIKKPISPIIQGMPRINSLTYGDYLSSSSLPPLVEPASSAGPSSSFADAEDNEFKGMLDNCSSIPISRSSGATFPSHSLMVSSNPNPGYPMNPSPNISSMLYNQAQNPNFFSVQGSAIDPAYLNQLGKIIVGGRSQETGLSTEISSSSAASKQEVTSNRPLEDQIECPPICPIISSSDMLYFPWDY